MSQLTCIAVLLVCPGQVDAEPERPAPRSAFAKLPAPERLAFLKREAAQYEIYLDPEGEQRLQLTEPVLRFNDNVSGVVDAVQLLWVHDGRAQATASFWHRKDGLHAHEFQSLSDQPLTAQLEGNVVWRPGAGREAPTPVPEAPRPAAAGAARLAQMRSIMARFSAEVGSRRKRGLRLLRKPVHRDKRDGESKDAAWFAFAKGTNPEVLVLLELAEGADGNSLGITPPHG